VTISALWNSKRFLYISIGVVVVLIAYQVYQYYNLQTSSIDNTGATDTPIDLSNENATAMGTSKGDVNNPGNIRVSGIAWLGKDTPANSVFEDFDTLADGIKAMNSNLTAYLNIHGLNTITAIISRWAPPADNNNTSSYINFVSSQTGIDPNAVIDSSSFPAIIAAMSVQEGNIPVTVDQVNAALAS
jgi:hypothetical protein